MILERSYFVKDWMQDSGPLMRAVIDGEKLEEKGAPACLPSGVAAILREERIYSIALPVPGRKQPPILLRIPYGKPSVLR